MQIAVLIVALVCVGLIAGWLAGLIWKDQRPIGVRGDYIVAILASGIIGLIDWYVIPATGFSDRIKILGVATEPILGALLVLWLIRKARQ